MGSLNWHEYEIQVRKWVEEKGGSTDNVVFYHDGIVNEKCWNNAENLKILFILKEVHDAENHMDIVLRDGVNWQNICKHSDIIGPEAESTWRKLSTLAAGFEKAISTMTNILAEDYVLHDKPKDDHKNNHINSVNKIAIINLKKLGSGNVTKSKDSQKTIDYSKHCERFQTYIREQIVEIEPHIIVCCGPDVFTLFNQYVYPEYKNMMKSYIKNDGVIVISAFHPTAPKSYDEYYVKPINDCLELYKNLKCDFNK